MNKIKELQEDYSELFRFLYNNRDNLTEKYLMDLGYKMDMARSIILDVKAFISRQDSIKSGITNQIVEKEKEFEKIIKAKDKLIKQTKKLKGKDLHKKNVEIKAISRKQKKLFKSITNLKRSFKRKVVFGGRKNLQDRTKGLITHEQFHELRNYPMWFRGDASHHGNRNFDLSRLNEGFKLLQTPIKTLITKKLNSKLTIKKIKMN